MARLVWRGTAASRLLVLVRRRTVEMNEPWSPTSCGCKTCKLKWCAACSEKTLLVSRSCVAKPTCRANQRT